LERLAGRFILLWGWRRALVAFAAGALSVFAQAPYDFFAVCFISFPILVWLLDGATVERPARFLRRLRPAFAVGWWFGFGYFVAGLWWVGGAMLVEADSFAWALPIAVVLLPAILGIFYGLAAALARLFWSDDIGRIAALAAAFALFEWLRTFVFTGFPWNPIGYAAMPTPLLMQSISVVGMVGMNALAVFVFAMPALLAGHRHVRTGLVLALLLVAAHVGFGYYRLGLPDAVPIRSLPVRIVQPAIDQAAKLDRASRDDIFRTLLNLSAAPLAPGGVKPKLIIWPETSLPFLLTDRPDALVAIGELLSDGQVLLAGNVRAEGKGDDAQRYYNSVVAINDKGEIVDAVDKLHLVPGGEYLPLSGMFRLLGIDRIVAMPTPFSAGTTRHPIGIADGLRAAVFICYEIVFPDEVDDGVKGADFIVNGTNDPWFGDTPGPYQHFRSAQIRAAETGVPLLRAANNGISGAVDSRGRVIDAFALNVRGQMDVSIAVPSPSPPLLGDPRMAGYFVLALLGLVGMGAYFIQRLRRI
jgi:apolipoprotein N-acyltransferase